MAKSILTKRIEFSASHFYCNPAWDEDQNRKFFGACSQEHGHNYLLEITLKGRVDPVTGMIINLYDLKQVVTGVLEEFDHKHLNLDMPYFEHLIPTTENFALVLWKKFLERPETQDLYSIRLFEEDNFWAELTSSQTAEHQSDASSHTEPTEASITRRYSLSPATLPEKHNTLGSDLLVNVTVGGPIDSLTGRTTDIVALDHLVNQHLLKRFNGKDPAQDPAFHLRPLSLFTLAQTIWPLLEPVSGGYLAKIAIQNQQGTQVEYKGITRRIT